MNKYLLHGVVLPERAQLSVNFDVRLRHLTTNKDLTAKVSVVLNQIAVWIETADEWEVFDLRNVVLNLVRNELAVIGYVHGFCYDVEITRVLNPALNIDYVYGIDIPCLVARRPVDPAARVAAIRQRTVGAEGVLIQRCFADLAAAMRQADDTGFYCYRAIESLMQHCAERHSGGANNRSERWEKFRAVAKCSEADVREIKAAADPVRHGNVVGISGEDRERLFKLTWDIVDGYLDNA